MPIANHELRTKIADWMTSNFFSQTLVTKPFAALFHQNPDLFLETGGNFCAWREVGCKRWDLHDHYELWDFYCLSALQNYAETVS